MSEKTEPLALSPAQITELTGFSTTHIYRLFSSGQLPRRKAGAKTLVMMSDLKAYLNSLPIDNISEAA